MEIIKNPSGDTLELQLRGRIDAQWADYVGAAIDEAIRGGHHLIQLNFSKIDYLSSAGLRTLINSYKQLKSVKGSLSITNPSEGAHRILKLAGLADLLLAPSRATAPPKSTTETQRIQRERAVFEIFPQALGETLECTLFGQPEKFFNQGFGETDCMHVPFPDGTLGLGLGAFGSSYADCQKRFGEFLAVAGSAAALPTDGANVPDWQVTQASLVPELQVLYGLRVQGQLARMIRFDAKPEPPGSIGLSELVDTALEISSSPTVAMVMLAETAGLVGAALRRSPARDGATARLEYPQARDWIAFNSERSTARHLALIVGVVSSQTPPELAPFLRPVGSGSSALGHLHAAYFPYRPVQRGELNLRKTVTDLLSVESAQGLLHLLPDDRAIEGTGQTDLMRGAVWAGPISRVQRSGN